jgi:hypothetical protein
VAVYATVAADEAVQLGGRAASGDGGFVALELLAYGTASTKRELRRVRFAPGIDDVHHVHEGLFRGGTMAAARPSRTTA